ASGGMVFSAGLGSDTVAVTDPTFTDSATIWPLITGIAIALIPHILKAIARPILYTVSGGLTAPVVSTLEDSSAVGLTIFAILAPIIGVLFLIAIAWFAVRRMKKARLSRREPGHQS